MKKFGRICSVLLSIGLAVPASADEQSTVLPKNANAAACGADTSHAPVKSYARGFSGPWSSVSDEQRSAPGQSQTAALWPRQGGGTFVQLWLLDEPSTASWSQRIDYCFAPDASVMWLESRYNRLEEDSRIDRYEFNGAGTATKHTEQCLNPNSEATRAADERCKDVSAFPSIKRLADFPFLKHAAASSTRFH